MGMTVPASNYRTFIYSRLLGHLIVDDYNLDFLERHLALAYNGSNQLLNANKRLVPVNAYYDELNLDDVDYRHQGNEVTPVTSKSFFQYSNVYDTKYGTIVNTFSDKLKAIVDVDKFDLGKRRNAILVNLFGLQNTSGGIADEVIITLKYHDNTIVKVVDKTECQDPDILRLTGKQLKHAESVWLLNQVDQILADLLLGHNIQFTEESLLPITVDTEMVLSDDVSLTVESSAITLTGEKEYTNIRHFDNITDIYRDLVEFMPFKVEIVETQDVTEDVVDTAEE